MINKLIDMEIKYVKNFSKSFEYEDRIRFSDDILPDMYSHNFTLIKNDVDPKNVIKIIRSEIEERKRLGKDFLRIEFSFPIDDEILNNLPIAPEISKYDYMYIKAEPELLSKGNKDCVVKEASTKDIMNDGIEVDIQANEGNMGREFAVKRIKRKVMVYGNPNSNLNLFVCYHNEEPTGNCELLIEDKIAKIEDFDILEKFQKKGFGTSVLKHLLKVSRESNAQIAYLITDSEDTAKEMYNKCGFLKVGEKTELFFPLVNKN